MSAIGLPPVGRDQLLARLTPLPPVALIRAPPSTGKRTCALYQVRQANVAAVDQRFWPAPEYRDDQGRAQDPSGDNLVPLVRFDPELTITHVREIIEWSRTAPLASPFKVAIIRLSHVRPDGSSWAASASTCAALLKTLEEPPRHVRFLLLAAAPVLPMIRSRSVCLNAGLLSTEHVAQILERVSDLSGSDALRVAALGGGRVDPALKHRASADDEVRVVIDVLTHLVAGDLIGLTEKMRAWSDQDTAMLVRWAHERISGQEQVFRDSGAPELSRAAAERVLRVIRQARGGRARMVLGAVASLVAK